LANIYSIASGVLMLLGHSHPNALYVLFWSHLPAYDFLLCRQNSALLNELQNL
jgi:hypothetical protein